MRHFLLVSLPGTIAPCTLGMLAATAVARLIAPPGSCYAGSASRSLAHSRCCRGRNRSRSAPARSSMRRETGARLHLPVCRRRTDVDEGPHRWDTAPAYVPRHVVGRGADANCQVVIGVAPVFNKDRPLAHLLPHSV